MVETFHTEDEDMSVKTQKPWIILDLIQIKQKVKFCEDPSTCFSSSEMNSDDLLLCSSLSRNC